jgi:hypothetical protein
MKNRKILIEKQYEELLKEVNLIDWISCNSILQKGDIPIFEISKYILNPEFKLKCTKTLKNKLEKIFKYLKFVIEFEQQHQHSNNNNNNNSKQTFVYKEFVDVGNIIFKCCYENYQQFINFEYLKKEQKQDLIDILLFNLLLFPIYKEIGIKQNILIEYSILYLTNFIFGIHKFPLSKFNHILINYKKIISELNVIELHGALNCIRNK